MKRLAIVALSALMSVNAFAVFSETEPNNTRAQANNVILNLRAAASPAAVGLLNLGTNDSDFFSINLQPGDVLTAVTLPIGNANYTSPDTVMALFDATGATAIVWNDDAGPGKGSAIFWQATYSGTFYIAITGFHGPDGRDDINYYENATHTQTGPYLLTVSVVPEPASMIALGSGLVGLLALRRRRK